MEIGEDFDTMQRKVAKNTSGGLRRLTTAEIDAVWEDIQKKTRQGLGWIPPMKLLPAEV